MARGRAGRVAVLAVSALVAFPAAASAHGPVDPIASSYLARVRTAPPGLEAKVVDGDLRMWLRVPRGTTVVVIDYRGAPYLRFSPSGVAVNQNSSMWYLNQSPVALTPPTYLTATTPPKWEKASSGDTFIWHDGRLHALATVALTPGAAFVGTWRIPLLLNGRPTAISGGLWHANNPSIVWFWPILVLLASVLAILRLHRSDWDRRLAQGLGIAAVIALSAAVLARQLHGRPMVSAFQMAEIVVVLGFALYALYRLLFARHGYFTYFSIAVVALWQGAMLIPTLLDGFVLAVGPAFAVRAAAVLCLATGICLLPLVFRLAEVRDSARTPERELADLETEDDSAWELA